MSIFELGILSGRTSKRAFSTQIIPKYCNSLYLEINMDLETAFATYSVVHLACILNCTKMIIIWWVSRIPL